MFTFYVFSLNSIVASGMEGGGIVVFSEEGGAVKKGYRQIRISQPNCQCDGISSNRTTHNPSNVPYILLLWQALLLQ